MPEKQNRKYLKIDTHKQTNSKRIWKWNADGFVQWMTREASGAVRSPEGSFIWHELHGGLSSR